MGSYGGEDGLQVQDRGGEDQAQSVWRDEEECSDEEGYVERVFEVHRLRGGPGVPGRKEGDNDNDAWG